MTPTMILALLAGTCVEVPTPMILAGQLKAAIPEFSAMEDSLEFGYAPVPGATRHIPRPALAAFAFRNGVALHSPPALCVVRRVRTLNTAELEAALRETVARLLPGARAAIEIIDHLRLPVPDGNLVLLPGDLVAAPDGAAIWKGRVEYDRNRSVPVWVKARVLVDGKPFNPGTKSSAPAVRKGDMVRVASQSGPVRIAVEASALEAGRIGEVVELQARANKSRIRARITGPGEALVTNEENLNEANRAGVHSGVNGRIGQGQGKRQEVDAP